MSEIGILETAALIESDARNLLAFESLYRALPSADAQGVKLIHTSLTAIAAKFADGVAMEGFVVHLDSDLVRKITAIIQRIAKYVADFFKKMLQWFKEIITKSNRLEERLNKLVTQVEALDSLRTLSNSDDVMALTSRLSMSVSHGRATASANDLVTSMQGLQRISEGLYNAGLHAGGAPSAHYPDIIARIRDSVLELGAKCGGGNHGNTVDIETQLFNGKSFRVSYGITHEDASTAMTLIHLETNGDTPNIDQVSALTKSQLINFISHMSNSLHELNSYKRTLDSNDAAQKAFFATILKPVNSFAAPSGYAPRTAHMYQQYIIRLTVTAKLFGDYLVDTIDAGIHLVERHIKLYEKGE